MLTLPSSVRFYLASDSVDLRKGFDKLAGLARSVAQQDPMSGHVFLFYNARRNRLKALWWDRTGYVLLYKRLERGTFPVPTGARAGQRHVEIDAGELSLLLEGIDPGLARRSRRWYRSPHNGLASRNSI